MYVKSIEIENYKSFLQAQRIELEPGFNLFVGANNSGKTTALESMDIQLSDLVPHRSIANLASFGDAPSPESRLRLQLATGLAESRGFISSSDYYLPLPEHELSKVSANSRMAAEDLFDRLWDTPNFIIYTEFGSQSVKFLYETIFGSSAYISNGSIIPALNVVFGRAGDSPQPVQVSRFSGIYPELFNVVNGCNSRIYRFSARRAPLDTSHSSGSPILQPDATNLPYCINHLHTNDAEGHRVLCELVHRVFPSVKWIQAPPIPGSQTFQLQCLPLAPSARRSDLAVPLGRMGSGIGNVIAILYVMLTSRFPQVIAIDEPNSFLHPKALRELLSILGQEGARHQYVLTAHSPDVLTAVEPATITLFELENYVTVTKQVSGKALPRLRTELADLGIRMTDLHGRDRVLWVEGQTEELILPELLQHFCPELSAGTAVLRVENTGAFEKKGLAPTEVAKIYRRLTESSALVPPMVAILLDKENRREADCAKITAASDSAIHFLDCKMIENYVLDSEAICAVMNELGETVTFQLVSDELNAKLQGDKRDLHGAQILGDVFSKLSEARLTYRKTRDTPMLFKWMLANRPDSLAELGAFLRNLLDLSAPVERFGAA